MGENREKKEKRQRETEIEKKKRKRCPCLTFRQGDLVFPQNHRPAWSEQDGNNALARY